MFIATLLFAWVISYQPVTPTDEPVGASLVQVRNKADAKLADIWPKLVQKQNAYYAKNGKYFQLLVSPVLQPDDGTDSPFTARYPSDEKFIKDVDVAWAETVPFQIEVDEWVGPDGAGFKAMVTVRVNGSYYRRERDNLNNDTGWYPYDPNNPRP